MVLRYRAYIKILNYYDRGLFYVFSCSGVWSIDYTYNLLLLVDTLQRTFRSTSPRLMSPYSQNFLLKCFLKGWPPPRVVWYRGDRQMINGSQGFYHIEERRSQCDQAILESTLHFHQPARNTTDVTTALLKITSMDGRVNIPPSLKSYMIVSHLIYFLS